MQVYLYDKYENLIHNLSDSDYTFTSHKAKQNDRFVILFKNEVLNISDNILQQISIVPNPTSGNITINSPKIKVNSVIVFDIRGRKLMEKKYTDTQYNLNISALQSAIYFLKINTSEGTFTKRIIKQ